MMHVDSPRFSMTTQVVAGFPGSVASNKELLSLSLQLLFFLLGGWAFRECEVMNDLLINRTLFTGYCCCNCWLYLATHATGIALAIAAMLDT